MRCLWQVGWNQIGLVGDLDGKGWTLLGGVCRFVFKELVVFFHHRLHCFFVIARLCFLGNKFFVNMWRYRCRMDNSEHSWFKLVVLWPIIDQYWVYSKRRLCCNYSHPSLYEIYTIWCKWGCLPCIWYFSLGSLTMWWECFFIYCLHQ